MEELVVPESGFESGFVPVIVSGCESSAVPDTVDVDGSSEYNEGVALIESRVVLE